MVRKDSQAPELTHAQESQRCKHHHKFSPSIRKGLKNLCTYNNWKGCEAFIQEVFVIALTIHICLAIPILYAPAIFIIGSRQRGLATLVHEASHKTLFNDRTLFGRFSAAIIGRISGFAILQLFTSYWT